MRYNWPAVSAVRRRELVFPDSARFYHMEKAGASVGSRLIGWTSGNSPANGQVLVAMATPADTNESAGVGWDSHPTPHQRVRSGYV